MPDTEALDMIENIFDIVLDMEQAYFYGEGSTEAYFTNIKMKLIKLKTLL